MPIESFFSLSPLNPYVNTYDAANPNAPHAVARLSAYGAIHFHYYPNRLENQYSNDEIIIGQNAVPISDTNLYSSISPGKQCCIYIGFTGYKVTEENQYLLLFDLQERANAPVAQIFVNGELVDTEEVTGIEQHAILLDCPGE